MNTGLLQSNCRQWWIDWADVSVNWEHYKQDFDNLKFIRFMSAGQNYVKYANFHVGSAHAKYTLHADGFTGIYVRTGRI